jgi:hypothetical protein
MIHRKSNQTEITNAYQMGKITKSSQLLVWRITTPGPAQLTQHYKDSNIFKNGCFPSRADTELAVGSELSHEQLSVKSKVDKVEMHARGEVRTRDPSLTAPDQSDHRIQNKEDPTFLVLLIFFISFPADIQRYKWKQERINKAENRIHPSQHMYI